MELGYQTCVVDDRAIQNLALIGFMGTGKSTVGRIVAIQLGFSFLDTDHAIESQCGISVRCLFEKYGEAVFRERERQLVNDLEMMRSTVIATGGGLPAQPGNLASLKKHAFVVCLCASPEAIYERVRAHSHRPLLNNPDPLGKIRELLAAREPFYRQADVLMNSEFRTAREVALQIVHHYRSAAGLPR